MATRPAPGFKDHLLNLAVTTALQPTPAQPPTPVQQPRSSSSGTQVAALLFTPNRKLFLS